MFDWITDFVEATGYLGIALLMLLENVFPPIPSELIMPLAGFQAARGDLHIAAVVGAGTVGSVAGATFWYLVGRAVGIDRLRTWSRRHGRWLTLGPREIDGARDWFARHCGKAVFLGRLVPTVRSLISIPAGVVEMALPRFLSLSAAGSLVWTGALALAGFGLEGQYERVQAWVNPVSNAVFALIVVAYLYRVATFGRRQRKAA